MNGIVAENGKVVTDEMIADWESALERDEWPSGWVNVGEIVEGKLPKAAPETVTLSLKVPAAMKRALENEAKAEGKSTGAYARGILADGLMAAGDLGIVCAGLSATPAQGGAEPRTRTLKGGLEG